jgi:DNA polymerase-3 subunit epsilon
LPTSVCAIGAARFEQGRETGAFRSLVRIIGPIRFGRIHGLEARELAGAPEWPVVWKRFLEFAGDIRHLVAYRAEFDRGAILAMCGSHGIRLPALRFLCAARMVEARVPGAHDLAEAVRLFGLSFPGRHHDPLADARAAGAIVIACGGLKVPGRAP